jgi:CHAT domain-containing protein
VFQDGLLTSRELESMDLAPRLVVSNACLSARTSERVVTGALAEGRDAHLVATLADEFFRRGVRDYVGTAWEVNDEGAILFAEALYGALLDGRSSLGAALLRARRALAARQNVFGALWAAYQHYGDPTAALVEVSEPAARGAARRAARRSGPPRTPRTSRPRAPSGRRSAP